MSVYSPAIPPFSPVGYSLLCPDPSPLARYRCYDMILALTAAAFDSIVFLPEVLSWHRRHTAAYTYIRPTSNSRSAGNIFRWVQRARTVAPGGERRHRPAPAGGKRVSLASRFVHAGPAAGPPHDRPLPEPFPH